MRINNLFAVALVVLASGGCSFSSIVHKDALDFNATVEEVNNQLLVTNILRARDKAPTYLAAFNSVRGTLSATVGTGNVTVPFGPGVQAATGFRYQAMPSFSLATGPTFDVAALDAKDTTQGLLKPIDPLTWEYYWHRNYKSGFLLNLFLASFSENEGHPIRNDPEDAEHYAKFSAQIESWRVGNVYLNTFTVLEPVTNQSFTATEFKTQIKDWAGLNSGGFRVGLTEANGSSYMLLRESSPSVVICGHERISGAEGSKTVLKAYGFTGSSLTNHEESCQMRRRVVRTKDPMANDAIQLFAGQNYVLRSTDGIIQYLGQVLRAPGGVTFKVTGPNNTAVAHVLFKLHETAADGATPAISDRIAVSYRGKTYFVRQGDPVDHTLEVLALVTQLINSNKNANEIPATKAVQILP